MRIMQISYGVGEGRKAAEGCVEVYRIAEEKLGLGCFKWNREELRNAFQVLRYAIKEWAEDKPRGVVWQMLMSGENDGQEVGADLADSENVIYCEDAETGAMLEEMLRKEGYEEATGH
jgi:hypothetical protein